MLVSGTRKLMQKNEVDKILETFVCNMVYWALMTFIIIAAIGQLGIQTTSLIAVMGAAGLAVGLALQGSLSNFCRRRPDRDISSIPGRRLRGGSGNCRQRRAGTDIDDDFENAGQQENHRSERADNGQHYHQLFGERYPPGGSGRWRGHTTTISTRFALRCNR